jgi:hypothetical protein
MLRAVGFALLLVMGAAVPAAANGGYGGESGGSAAQQGAGIHGVDPVAQELTTLQLTRTLAGSRSLSVNATPAGSPSEIVASMPPLAARAPERREKKGPSTLPWDSGGRSGLRLPLTGRLSFGVAYRHLEGEDLWRRNAEAGSVDYDSHDFIVRAHWRF